MNFIKKIFLRLLSDEEVINESIKRSSEIFRNKTYEEKSKCIVSYSPSEAEYRLRGFTSLNMISEINRRNDDLEKNGQKKKIYVIGRNSGHIMEGEQSSGMKNAICHACGLGDKCFDKDCPNTNINPHSLYGIINSK